MRVRLPAAVVVAITAVYLVVAVPWAITGTWARLRSAVATRGLGVRALRPFVLGREYAAAIEKIQHTLDRHEPYLIDEAVRDGSILWPRYDLLPRPAIAGPSHTPITSSDRACWVAQLRWQVIVQGVRRAPLLIEHPARVPPGCPPAPWWQPEPSAPGSPERPAR